MSMAESNRVFKFIKGSDGSLQRARREAKEWKFHGSPISKIIHTMETYAIVLDIRKKVVNSLVSYEDY